MVGKNTITSDLMTGEAADKLSPTLDEEGFEAAGRVGSRHHR